MGRRLISSGSPYEPVAGFSRAVVAGRHVHVAGTAPVMAGRRARLPTTRTSRRAAASTIIVDALAEAGARPEDVVRTRMYVTSAEHWDAVARAHGDVFASDPSRRNLRRHAASRPALVGGNRSRRHTRPVKQIYPASITSKSFAAGGSVLDHKFGQSEPYTLGVEEEYMLLDPETFDLVQHVDTVLEAIAGHEFAAHVNPELMQSVLEVATPVCRTPSDVERALRQLRAYVTGIAQEKGLRVGSAGTHPFSLFERQRITARDRYHNLVDQMQYVARRELIFGLHVHVAVSDPDTAIQVVNGMLQHLAPLLALSASSPFWRGEPTGLSSSRQMVFAAFPRSGPPPRFRNYAEYAEVVGQLEKTGCIADYTHIWWDIRPHPRLGTVEVRICDAVTRLEDAIAITAYVQSLVKLLSERHEAGETIPTYHRILTTENKWLAGRYGLEAPVMDLATGKRNRVAVAQLIRRTLKEIEPHARELGAERELEGVRDILARGNGSDRQLRIFNANRDIVEVVSEIANATEIAPMPSSLVPGTVPDRRARPPDCPLEMSCPVTWDLDG